MGAELVSVAQIGSINTKDEVLNRIQAELQRALNPVLTCPLLNGVPVGPVALASGVPKEVNHGLGRLPLGYLITGLNANVVVWSPAATKMTITLTSSADCTVSLWVF